MLNLPNIIIVAECAGCCFGTRSSRKKNKEGNKIKGFNFVYNNEVYLFCEIWLTEDGGFYHSYFTEFNISMNPKPSPTWKETDGEHSFEYTDGVLFLESSPGNNKVRVYERV